MYFPHIHKRLELLKRLQKTTKSIHLVFSASCVSPSYLLHPHPHVKKKQNKKHVIQSKIQISKLSLSNYIYISKLGHDFLHIIFSLSIALQKHFKKVDCDILVIFIRIIVIGRYKVFQSIRNHLTNMFTSLTPYRAFYFITCDSNP